MVQKNIEKSKKSRVFVGLSGGVDSSVSAALLKEQGYDVTGVFIKVWQPDFWGGCTMVADRLDAMRVCAKLNIPFYTLDLEKEYKKEVVDYMIEEYKAGRTPNPDVMCNKYVKFGGFFDWAMKNGADYVATGHYSQVKSYKVNKVERTTKKLYKPDKLYKLLTGADANKDQSYFLWTLTQKQLAKTLFPVGNIEKPEVRKLAKKFDLPTAVKKDSQGLCFIGKVEMAEFLKHFIKSKDGAVLNVKGEKIGTHKGAVFYTIGQRHGFIIDHKNTSEQKSFVIAKNIEKNTITVSDKFLEEGNTLNNKEIYISEVNWTANPPISEQIYEARIRYRGELYKCQIEIKNKKTKVIFKEEIKNCTPGQSIVFYEQDICLGGGIIV
jgi:tRNA-uridine 2-sulfurtransferase